MSPRDLFKLLAGSSREEELTPGGKNTRYDPADIRFEHEVEIMALMFMSVSFHSLY